MTQGFDRFAVLLADRQRARILVFHFGELVDHSELLDERPRDDDTHGHLDRGDAASRVAAQVAAHLRRAADVAFAMFQTEAFEHLTLGGPEPVVRSLEGVLHPYLRRRLCDRIAVGVSAGMGDIREAVLDVEREVERQREAGAVERLRRASGFGPTGGGGVGRRAGGGGRASCRPTAGVVGLRRGGVDLSQLWSPRPGRPDLPRLFR